MDHQETTFVDEVWRKAQTLEARDHQLWLIHALVILVVVVGFGALILPNVRWNLGTLVINGRHVPELLFGFFALILFFNIYALWQEWVLRSTREELLRTLIRSESIVKRPLIDPLTQVFSRRYLDVTFAREVSRADRGGTSLTLLMIDVDGFKSVNARFGHLTGDRVLSRVGQLLKETFRGADTILRYGGDEFLVVMPQTDEQQAQRPVERLLVNVDHWNRENAMAGYKLSLSCGLATYTRGGSAKEALEVASQRMKLSRAAHR